MDDNSIHWLFNMESRRSGLLNDGAKSKRTSGTILFMTLSGSRQSRKAKCLANSSFVVEPNSGREPIKDDSRDRKFGVTCEKGLGATRLAQGLELDIRQGER